MSNTLLNETKLIAVLMQEETSCGHHDDIILLWYFRGISMSWEVGLVN
jgi:hypothetical protein